MDAIIRKIQERVSVLKSKKFPRSRIKSIRDRASSIKCSVPWGRNATERDEKLSRMLSEVVVSCDCILENYWGGREAA